MDSADVQPSILSLLIFIHSALSSSKIAFSVILDLKNQFDTVYPQILQGTDCLNQWFRSHWTNRSQCLKLFIQILRLHHQPCSTNIYYSSSFIFIVCKSHKKNHRILEQFFFWYYSKNLFFSLQMIRPLTISKYWD